MPVWTSSSGKIELKISLPEVKCCPSSGPADAYIDKLVAKPAMVRQLFALDPADVAEELRGYGAWDETELADRQQNHLRLLWIACLDIKEGKP